MEQKGISFSFVVEKLCCVSIVFLCSSPFPAWPLPPPFAD